MKQKDWFFAGVEAVCWYAFIYYLLYSIRNPIPLWQSALLLTFLLYCGGLACPLVRNSCAWKNMWGEK